MKTSVNAFLAIAATALLTVLACSPKEGGVTKASPPPASSAGASSAAQAGQPAAAQPLVGPPIKVRSGYASTSGGQGPHWLAKEAGIFERNGLDVEQLFMRGNPWPAMLAGEIAIAQGAPGGAFAANLEGGADFVVVLAVVSGDTILAVKPSITRIEDLKGRTIGVPGRGSDQEYTIGYALKKLGMDPDKDVNIIDTVDQVATLAALEAGSIDGGMLTRISAVPALNAGYRSLLPRGVMPSYASLTLVTRKSLIQSDEELVRRYVRSYVEAMRLFRTDREQGFDVLRKYGRLEDPEMLQVIQEHYGNVFRQAPWPTVENIGAVLDILSRVRPEAATRDPKEFFDDRFIRELDASGLLAKLVGD